jgi:hypothetical protein
MRGIAALLLIAVLAGLAAAANVASAGRRAHPDTTAPTASISSPTQGASTRGTITVSASAVDPTPPNQVVSGVASVQLKVDGQNFGAPIAAPGPYTASLDTTSLADGDHTLSAFAVDKAGNVGQNSAAVTIHVNNNTSLPNISLPIRGAFMYPWYPETWYSDQHYHPVGGNYDSGSFATIDRQLNQMSYANIGLSIDSWWGQGTTTDNRISTILNETTAYGSPVKQALYYEQEGTSNPSVAQIQSDLQYINSKYGKQPAYARIGGKPVVFVYAGSADGCANSTDMVQRWVTADDGLGHPDYVVLKVFSGYAACPVQPDNWHQYGPATRSEQQGTHSYYVSPGFWLHSDSMPRLVRDATAFQGAVASMQSASVDFKLVETWNEWGEGTQVEAATEYGSCYLDILHANGAGPLPSSCGAPPPPPPPPPGSPCGTKTGPSQITKVIWIVMENNNYSSIYPSQPYETQIANQCGLATNYDAIGHPSLPNYIALTTGSTQGITDDNGPSSHPLDVDNIYHQALTIDGSAKQYSESMSGNCQLTGSGPYYVRHAPWAYFVNGVVDQQRTQCQANDVPMGTYQSGNFHDDVVNGTLPRFSFVTPNGTDDDHDSNPATGDAYLSNLVPFIISGPDYQAGHVAIFIVFDENGSGAPNQVYASVISPYTVPGTQSATSYTHYSLLRTTEEILGLPLLAGAQSANSMLTAFNLG